MDTSVPKGAALLLDFIAGFESGGRYDVVFGEHQNALTTPITLLTLDKLRAVQRSLARRYGSSASGRYQIMMGTLDGLRATLKLDGATVFTANLQDRLGYQLLKQRGYGAFKAGSISVAQFGKRLAQEWASLPVLERTRGAHRIVSRGETFYAGDRLNRALVAPERVEAILAKVKAQAT